jgi:hypothetical protein
MFWLLGAGCVIAALGFMTLGYAIAAIHGFAHEDRARREGEAFGRRMAEFDALFSHTPDLPPLPPEMERLWHPADTFIRALRILPTELIDRAFNEGVGESTRKGIRP